MALIGTLVGPAVRLATDGMGLPIVAADEPDAPDGFKPLMTFEEVDGSIAQTWSIVPDSAADDAVRLAAMSAEKLADEDAAKVPQLIRSWYVGEASYAAGTRVTLDGCIFRCLQTHAPSIGIEPDVAPEFWERIQR
nr:MAG TPA: ChiA1-BD-binding domain protein [Bacteriophage sp.]